MLACLLPVVAGGDDDGTLDETGRFEAAQELTEVFVDESSACMRSGLFGPQEVGTTGSTKGGKPTAKV